MGTDHKAKTQTTKLPEQTPADQDLDQALEDSFPASDPPQQTRPGAHVGGPYRSKQNTEDKAGHRRR
jgi:hypothetical protein